MSYILEALRKVEQQRDHLPLQGLSSRRRFYVAMPDSSRPRIQLVMVVAAAGALVSGAIISYLIMYSKTAQPVMQTTAQQVPVPSGAEQTSFVPNTHEKDQPVVARVEPIPLPETHNQAQTRPMITQGRQQEEKKPPQSDKPSSEKKPETKQPAPHPKGQRTKVATVHNTPSKNTVIEGVLPRSSSHERIAHNGTPDKDIVAMTTERSTLPVKEQALPPDAIESPSGKGKVTSGEPELLSSLSPQLQSIVPKMSIDGFVYSLDPKQRVVIINMKFYNEGQRTPDGVIVEAIRQEDIICSYQGQRFRLSR